MEEILHQLIGSLSQYLQDFLHPRWCRISSINSITDFPLHATTCQNKKPRTFTLEGSSSSAADAESAAGPKPQDITDAAEDWVGRKKEKPSIFIMGIHG